MNNKTLAILTALYNSDRASHATNGELRDARSFAKCHCSFLWEVFTDAYSGVQLAATFGPDGKIR
jgi:hypothetical protein